MLLDFYGHSCPYLEINQQAVGLVSSEHEIKNIIVKINK